MSFGAIDQFQVPRREALQPPSSEPIGSSAATSGNERLPRLRGSNDGIQTGPERDVFQKSTSQAAAVEKPSSVPVMPAAEKSGASGWLQTIKHLLPAKGEPAKVEKPQNAMFTALSDAAKKLSGAAKPTESGSPTFAETMVGKAQMPNPSQFSAVKVNALKKTESSGLASMFLSMASLGSLASMVAGPAALVAKPGLVNTVASTLPAKLP